MMPSTDRPILRGPGPTRDENLLRDGPGLGLIAGHICHLECGRMRSTGRRRNTLDRPPQTAAEATREALAIATRQQRILARGNDRHTLSRLPCAF